MLRFVAPFALFASANLANALTLADIEQEYARKQAMIGTYRVAYTSSTQIDGPVQGVQTPKTLLVLLKGETGYRLELSVYPEVDGTPELYTIQTDDGEQHRSVSFDSGAVAVSGSIDTSYDPVNVYSTATYTPIGLAGLHDSAALVDAGSSIFMSDVRALVLDSRSRLVEESVSLDGEATCLVEWPAESAHPQMRFWLSADKGFALLKYESYDLSNDNQAQTRLVNTDFLEVSPGLFLPQHSVFQVLPAIAGGEQHTTVIDMQSCDLKVATTPTEFRLEIPEGVHVYDQRLGVDYKTGFAANLEDLRRFVARTLPQVPIWVVVVLSLLALGGIFVVIRVFTKGNRGTTN